MNNIFKKEELQQFKILILQKIAHLECAVKGKHRELTEECNDYLTQLTSLLIKINYLLNGEANNETSK